MPELRTTVLRDGLDPPLTDHDESAPPAPRRRGRPPGEPGTTLYIRLPRSLVAKLKREADREHRTLVQQVRVILLRVFGEE